MTRKENRGPFGSLHISLHLPGGMGAAKGSCTFLLSCPARKESMGSFVSEAQEGLPNHLHQQQEVSSWGWWDGVWDWESPGKGGGSPRRPGAMCPYAHEPFPSQAHIVCEVPILQHSPQGASQRIAFLILPNPGVCVCVCKFLATLPIVEKWLAPVLNVIIAKGCGSYWTSARQSLFKGNNPTTILIHL